MYTLSVLQDLEPEWQTQKVKVYKLLLPLFEPLSQD